MPGHFAMLSYCTIEDVRTHLIVIKTKGDGSASALQTNALGATA
jgi:hypothetical protein